MRRLINIEDYGAEEQKEESEALNLRRAAMDNNFLLEAVSENKITQETFNKIQLIKDVLQHIYPDLWDLQVQVRRFKVRLVYRLPLEPVSVQPFGCYFGAEGFDEYGDIDNREYYLENPVPPPSRRTEEMVEHRYYNFSFVVRYPEVVITNTAEETHTLRDLYYKFDIISNIGIKTTLRHNDEGQLDIVQQRRSSFQHTIFNVTTDLRLELSPALFNTALDGARSTVSTIEFLRGYAHSHLNTRSHTNFTTFLGCCLGSGEICMTLNMLRSNITRELMTLFLFQLDAYAKWESNEGGPYIRINSLNKGKAVTRFPGISMESAQMYINRRLKAALLRRRAANEEIPIDWKIEDGMMRIVDNERFENFCKHQPTYEPAHYGNNEVFYKDSQNNYYDTSQEAGHFVPNLPNNDRYYLIFQGEKISLTVTPPEGQRQFEPTEFILNPNLKNYIKRKLESYANYKKIKGDITARAHQISHRAIGSGQNQVPLQIHS